MENLAKELLMHPKDMQVMFKDLPEGTKFQFVNTVMGAVLPNSAIYVKTNVTQAMGLEGKLLTIRPYTLVQKHD